MAHGTALSILALFALLLSSAQASRRERKYNYFDDYLSSLDEEQQSVITGDNTFFEGSGGEDSNELQDTRLTLPLRTGLTGSKDVACCSLGQLAGDKGYHCVSNFYAARIVLRNQNRAHNRKLGFYGREHVSNYGNKAMRTFEQCVATRKMFFNKCCHLAAEERKGGPHFDTLQWKRYEMKMKKIRMPQKI